MKYFIAFAVTLLLAVPQVNAFTSSSSFSGSSLSVSAKNSNGITMEYIPSGMSKEQWKKMKDAEKKKNSGKNLGKSGITTFSSRSFDDWQKAGGKNLFPVDPRSAKSAKELPYMQRPGGSADDSDLEKKKGGFFNFGKKKKEPEPEPEPPKKNFWTF